MKRLAALIGALLATLPALAQPANDVPDATCRIAQPEFPAAAKRRGATGSVEVQAIADADGRVTHGKIVRSSDIADLDAAALQAVLKSRCRPYLQDGKAVAVTFTVPFVFRDGPPSDSRAP